MTENDEAGGGYRRPPGNTRFRPGRSGNPKGRPRRARNLKADLATLLQKRVAIREDGEVRHVSRQEAMLLSLCLKAIQGDTKASNQLFTLVTKMENQDTSPSQSDIVSDNDRTIVEDFLRRNCLPIKEGSET